MADLGPSWQQYFDAVAAQEGIWLFRHKKNKLRVALVPLPSNNIAALSIVFTIGSKAEVTGMTGSAHILEHELFKKFPGFDIWHDLGDYGARINAQDADGYTPLHIAAGYQYVETVAQLLEAGADPDLEDGSGRTPLQLIQVRARATARVR